MNTLDIIPNKKIYLEIDKKNLEIISQSEDSICRIVIQDYNDYGICLPAVLEETSISFILPEQLCIFIPNQKYIIKFECILENQIIIPYINEAEIKIDQNEDTETQYFSGNQDEEDVEEENQIQDNLISKPQNHDEDEGLEDILNVIAPIKETQIKKKTKVEEIVKTLDEEFIKHALWQKPIENMPLDNNLNIQNNISGELQSDPEKDLLKKKMKNLLLKMIS